MAQVAERSIEMIVQDLEEAKVAESKLAEEANQATERLRAAASEGKLDLQRTAIAGKSLKEGSPLTKARKRAARKDEHRGGRGRPQAELASIKCRLSYLADDVLEGRQDKGVAAVASQVLNVYLRAVSVELKAREQLELVERLEALEEALEENAGKGGRRWRA